MFTVRVRVYVRVGVHVSVKMSTLSIRVRPQTVWKVDIVCSASLTHGEAVAITVVCA